MGNSPEYRYSCNFDPVKEALVRAGRAELIGFGPKCLLLPRKEKRRK